MPGMNSDNYLSPAVQRARDDQLEKDMLENRQKSEELQSFIEDQVAQVFQTYLRDYFQKELTLLRLSARLTHPLEVIFVRLKLSTLLARMFSEPGLLSKSTGLFAIRESLSLTSDRKLLSSVKI
jgi:Sec-independent protein secretion pathway component TatC